MARRNALLAFFAGTLALAVGYGSAFLPGPPPGWAAWPIAMGTTAVMMSACALGAVRGDGGLGRLRIPLALMSILLGGAFAAVLLAPASADRVLFLGLPTRAALMVFGIGLLPLFILPIAYALTFDDMTLNDADLARIRQAAAEIQARRVPARARGRKARR
ncbi:hypothetical protein [Longimicrobium terrae]|uniref:Uncharacterized protein n=1 Tax=Longimicrobium terrae TaxID=1639882 RepID=A0A841GY89_9BACT|nr:hypothetical protein [Longimicrobium terrae]MBB4636339.1 hypothetical protein [Longimicrobium terrae]MBB6070735.1 hypothetical protein [Longimicrobium terrae]NNC29714.1 hypothetical protein [Longimicrobium terrae]